MKIEKSSIFPTFWAFLPIIVEFFFLENPIVPFFFHYFLISTVATHNFRKTNEQIPRKTVYRSTDIDRSLIDFLSIVIKK